MKTHPAHKDLSSWGGLVKNKIAFFCKKCYGSNLNSFFDWIYAWFYIMRMLQAEKLLAWVSKCGFFWRKSAKFEESVPKSNPYWLRLFRCFLSKHLRSWLDQVNVSQFWIEAQIERQPILVSVRITNKEVSIRNFLRRAFLNGFFNRFETILIGSLCYPTRLILFAADAGKISIVNRGNLFK